MFVLFVASLWACDGGCGQKAAEIPKTPEARVEQMMSKMPVKTDSAMIIGDLDKMRSSVTLLKERLPNTRMVDSMQKQIQAQFGIDLLDAESWKRAGIAPKSSAAAGLYRSRVILMMYVENRQAFEKILTEKAKNAFEIDAVTKSEKVGKHQMKVLSGDPARQIAWLYDGKLALVSFPAVKTEAALEDGSATLVLGEVMDTKKETSVLSDAGFTAFRDSLVPAHPVAIWMNPRSSMESEEMRKQIEGDPNAKAAAEWVRANVTFFGAGLIAEGDQARLKAYMGTKPELAKQAQAVKNGASKYDWGAFASEKLMLGIRLSADIQKGYDIVLESLPEDNRRAWRRDLKRFGETYDLDLEADVIRQMGGHFGIFFYGIAGNPLALLGGQDPASIARALGLVMVLKLNGVEAVDKILARAVAGTRGMLVPRDVIGVEDEKLRAVQIGPPGQALGTLYAYEDRLVLATLAFGDSAVHKYLTDARDDKKLADAEKLNLGAEFQKQDAFSGAYFNSARAVDNLGGALAFGGVNEILQSLEEVQLKLDADDKGISATLSVDLTPAPAKSEGADKGTDKPADNAAGGTPAPAGDAQKADPAAK